MTTYRDTDGPLYEADSLDQLARDIAGPEGTWRKSGHRYQIIGPAGDSPFRIAKAIVEPVSVYTARIEVAQEHTPITLADRETLTDRRIVGYRGADWQLVAEDTVTAEPGTAAQLAADCLAHQTAAETDGRGLVRVRVWEGADADTGTDPDAEVYDNSPAAPPAAPYTAHVITTADQLGDPEVIVLTRPDETGATDAIATYPLGESDDWRQVLTDHGWRLVGEPTTEPYTMVEVDPVDWLDTVREATAARDQAQAELDRRDAAWRRTIADAMRAEGVSRRAVAAAAGVSEARAYQIRDGRR